MKLYNSLTRKKESFAPARDTRVNLFVCGPTVYDTPHLGHARTYLLYDAVVKFFRRRLGWDVFYLQNITDIDDKIIDKAREEKAPWRDIAARYRSEYHRAMDMLGIDAVSEYAPATDYIPEIVSQVERLRDKGHAYLIDGDGYYFDVMTFPSYGKLSGRTAEGAEDSVSRIDESVKKRNRADFALWKLSRGNEPGWETTLGFGRPGWHIEDTAITEKCFGAQYDIHGGGIDLIFPHHEAEIAQMEALSGKEPLVRLWMHAGLVTVAGEKMSKSKGNYISIADILASHSPAVIRMFVFSSHYRSPVDFNPDTMAESSARQQRLQEFYDRIVHYKAHDNAVKAEIIHKGIESVWRELEDNFNTPEAFARIFQLVTEAHSLIDTHSLSKDDTRSLLDCLHELNGIFGVLTNRVAEVPQNIRALADEREQARTRSDFQLADRLRDRIAELGYDVKDTPDGPRITKRDTQ